MGSYGLIFMTDNMVSEWRATKNSGYSSDLGGQYIYCIAQSACNHLTLKKE